jgi:ABC-type polysaccharide/polyol phosphate export permease
MSVAPSAPPRQLPRRVITGGRKSDAGGLLSDLAEGLKLHRTWRAFAWDEIQNRYRRSALGLAWLAISYLFFVAAIALFFGGFSEVGGGRFVQHVAFGYALFALMIAQIADGCQVFVVSSGWVKSANLPYSIYVYKGIARTIFPFLVQIGTAFMILPFFGWRPEPVAILALPALFLLFVTSIPVQYAFGLIAARNRDFGHLVGALSRFLFFTTPVIWVYEETSGVRRDVADFNPMTAFIEIARDPLLGSMPDATQWLIASATAVAAWALCLVIGAVMRNKLPFWV